jgi:hypothetical protein
MNLGMFNNFCSQAAENGILFYYSGDFSQNVIATLGDTVQQRLQSVGATGPARRKVFSAFIEMAQNILHYGDTVPGAGLRIGALAVGRKDEKYYVVCGNPVRTEHVERLRTKLEPLRTMTLNEIKQAYKQQLRNDEHESDTLSKGAGLGFLTVARESSEPIEYQIVTRSGEDTYAEFYLRATI